MIENRQKVRLRALLMWGCMTAAAGAGAALAATQVAVSSDGWQIPDGAEREHNPVPLDRAVLAKGQALYRSKCQRCHGASGKGNGPDADPKAAPGDLTDARRASRNPDGVMFYKIWNGRAKPKMPAMKADLTRTEVWTIIHHVKFLRRNDGVLAHRRGER